MNHLMVTAEINVFDSKHQLLRCRTLLDTCSTADLITEELADLLGHEKKECTVSIGAVNSLTVISKHTITATIRSRFNNYQRALTFLIVPNISSLIPEEPIQRETINIPRNIKLADPNFHQPAPIDMLLSAGTALSLLCIGQIGLARPNEPELFLQKTSFGWVIGGSVPSATSSGKSHCHFTNEQEINLERFWDIHEGSKQTHYTAEEKACREHFFKNVTKDITGRYQVALPFNEQISKLGNSRFIAEKRLKGLEYRLSRDPELKKQYNIVLQEYLDLGHMSRVNEDRTQNEGYYLPHHAVMKQSSLTTKLRVVFDGSCKTDTGISLNSTLMVGPTVQSDLFSILLRFRIHTYVITGDIEKMYRQFLVRPEDRKYQKVLWRSSSGQVQTYELNTVTFGLAPAPYLATECLNKLADDNEEQYPLASKIIKRDFYVDDLLTGASTETEAITLQNEITQILDTGRLSIRQWASNNPNVLKDLLASSVHKQLQLGDSSTIKTLGIYWDSSTDSIVYTIKSPTFKSAITKRTILSETCKIFDPLGLLAPVIITARILLQNLWELKLDWDESLPMDVHTQWIQYYKNLQSLNNIHFKRGVSLQNATHFQIHGFCDASSKAYGACIYMSTTNKQGRTETQLLCSKSRVAPLKVISIPKLELCGALLLARLFITTKEALPVDISDVHFWTDSEIVYHWLRTEPKNLKTFAANRVAEIQTKTNVNSWRHVRTHENPADLISRGVQPDEFATIQQTFWQQGPSWLNTNNWPPTVPPPQPVMPELKKVTCLKISTHSTNTILTRYSSLEKLQRVMAYCLRFINSSRKNKSTGPLTVPELRAGLLMAIRLTQEETFSEEIKLQRTKTTASSFKGKLSRLTPIYHEGLLRVGGRLTNAKLNFSQRHPIILPRNHHLTTLIIEHEHKIHLHAGIQATLYAIRRRYWPIDGRRQVAKIVNPCIKCFKAKPPLTECLMGNLPSARVTQSRPFSHVGIDYCGPFILKEKKYRNRKEVKVFIAVFVCLAVKAIHLEIVSDLSSQGFIAALRRFIGRRGFCSHIYSDNGTNFVGANRELQDIILILKAEQKDNKIQTYLASQSIQWHFIPPRSPNFGGLWEAAVKSFKFHLKRVAGANLLFTFEEFNTLIIEIEAVLNSRPLTPISSDPTDLLALTPGHFLIGESLTNLPDHDYLEISANRLNTWQHLQKVKQDFWKRWHQEYLNELTIRSKWTKGDHRITIGSLVLIREDNLPPLHWAMGRVIDVHPGNDGIIRTITVKTANSIVKRNVRKVAPLPIEETSIDGT